MPTARRTSGLAAPLRVLLVEDDEDFQAITLANLRRGFAMHGPGAGFHDLEVKTAGTLALALESLREHTFDVVLLDLELPDSIGITGTMEQMRDAAPSIPLVAVTGHEAVDDAVSSTLAGADGFLPKSELSPDRIARVVLSAVVAKRLS